MTTTVYQKRRLSKNRIETRHPFPVRISDCCVRTQCHYWPTVADRINNEDAAARIMREAVGIPRAPVTQRHAVREDLMISQDCGPTREGKGKTSRWRAAHRALVWTSVKWGVLHVKVLNCLFFLRMRSPRLQWQWMSYSCASLWADIKCNWCDLHFVTIRSYVSYNNIANLQCLLKQQHNTLCWI